MPCSSAADPSRRWHNWLALAALLLALVGLQPAAHAAAAPLENRLAALVLSDGSLVVNSRFAVTLNPTLVEALEQGVTLTFRLEFELTRPRSTSWWQELTSGFSPEISQFYRLSWHPLTRQYRVNFGGLYLSFARLEDALAMIGSARYWQVLPRSSVDGQPLKSFAGRLRLRLDTAQLPKPFQLNILKSTDWSLDSGWITVSGETP